MNSSGPLLRITEDSVLWAEEHRRGRWQEFEFGIDDLPMIGGRRRDESSAATLYAPIRGNRLHMQMVGSPDRMTFSVHETMDYSAGGIDDHENAAPLFSLDGVRLERLLDKTPLVEDAQRRVESMMRYVRDLEHLAFTEGVMGFIPPTNDAWSVVTDSRIELQVTSLMPSPLDALTRWPEGLLVATVGCRAINGLLARVGSTDGVFFRLTDLLAWMRWLLGRIGSPQSPISSLITI